MENKLREVSDILARKRFDRLEREGFGDYDELTNRFASVYRDMEPKDKLSARTRLLPLRAKIAEVEERTENIKVQRGLINARTGQALLNQHLTRQKIRKMELENEEQEEMIELYRAAVDAIERVGTGQMVKADFVVLDSLKQIGVKIPKKLKSGEQIQKQTNGGSSDAV